MKNNLLRVALYIRVSSEEQANSGDSIRDQKERCEKYIADHEDMALQDTYIDDGISGQKLKRDDFQRLLQSVKDRKVDLIIFTKLDRWFRNLRRRGPRGPCGLKSESSNTGASTLSLISFMPVSMISIFSLIISIDMYSFSTGFLSFILVVSSI